MKISAIFRPDSGAKAFFLSILVWGIGVGCFAAAMNNYLSKVYDMNSFDRGVLEFFRELPGLLLVGILALLHRFSDWKVMRIGTMISMLGAVCLLMPANKMLVTAFIMIFSMGEHLVMPIRSAIAMQVAKPECAGRALGFLTSIMNFGTVAGSVIVAVLFYIGVNRFGIAEKHLFEILWVMIALLMFCSTACTFAKRIPGTPSRRPKLLFARKFSKFYALELFYGARKQVFLTFAPYVLIREYGFSTASMALLLAICAGINVAAAPLIGKLTDRWGYRNIMIWDTIILSFVCLMYGFAREIFPLSVVYAVVCINFMLDAVISTTSLATNIYVREISSSREEVTATLSTGISINHLIAIMAAPLGGWVWVKYGTGVLFSFAAVMAVCNSIFAATLKKPGSAE